MTQRHTTTHLITAVISAATGEIFAPLNEIVAVVHDLTDGRLNPAEMDTMSTRIRDELVRQHPWLAGVALPDFEADMGVDTRVAKGVFIEELAARHGGCVEIECGTLTDIPGPALGLPEGVSIVRNAR